MDVKFRVGTQSQYDALYEKDVSALYYITDTHRVYKGTELFSVGALATEQVAGLLSPEDKIILDNIDSFGTAIIRGIYYNGKFYEEGEHAGDLGPEIPKNEKKLYVNTFTGEFGAGTAFSLINNVYVPVIPLGTPLRPGMVCLYDNKGSNADGAITQRAATQAIQEVQTSSTVTYDSQNKVIKQGNADVITLQQIKEGMELPTPMVYKGSLGNGGTISDLPPASAELTGYTYKVITAGSYRYINAKVGDLFICNGTGWTIIPSGDEPSGTVTNIATGEGLTGGPITTSGTISLADSGVQAGTYNTVTVDAKGRVTAGQSGLEYGLKLGENKSFNGTANIDASTNVIHIAEITTIQSGVPVATCAEITEYYDDCNLVIKNHTGSSIILDTFILNDLEAKPVIQANSEGYNSTEFRLRPEETILLCYDSVSQQGTGAWLHENSGITICGNIDRYKDGSEYYVPGLELTQKAYNIGAWSSDNMLPIGTASSSIYNNQYEWDAYFTNVAGSNEQKGPSSTHYNKTYIILGERAILYNKDRNLRVNDLGPTKLDWSGRTIKINGEEVLGGNAIKLVDSQGNNIDSSFSTYKLLLVELKSSTETPASLDDFYWEVTKIVDYENLFTTIYSNFYTKAEVDTKDKTYSHFIAQDVGGWFMAFSWIDHSTNKVPTIGGIPHISVPVNGYGTGDYVGCRPIMVTFGLDNNRVTYIDAQGNYKRDATLSSSKTLDTEDEEGQRVTLV